MVATVVEDERQLDGSRHLEIVGDQEDAELALRLVINRDGELEEAEMSLELDGSYTVIGFEAHPDVAYNEWLDLSLVSDGGRAVIRQRDDGDVDLTLTLDSRAEDDE